MPPLAAEIPALLALGALLLLPGLALVAAPWPVAPFLSLAFWLSSWSWLLAFSGSRETFVRAALLGFAALAALRLLKPLPLTRPRAATLAVLALGLVALGTFRAAPLPAHAAAPRQALLARLLVARDGWPATLAPFEPQAPFEGVDALALLAADVALLSGAPVWRCLRLAGLVAPGLVACALLFAVRRAGLGARADALALLPLAWLTRGQAAIGPAALLAAACAVVGLALLSRGTTRAPAVAAGACLGSAWLCDPALGLGAALLALPAVLVLAKAARRGPSLRTRLSVAALALAAFVGPAFTRLAAPGFTHPRLGVGNGGLDAAELQALVCLRDQGGPTDVLCVGDVRVALWAPSVADHAVALAPPSAGRCRYRLVNGPPSGLPVCAAGSVQIVEVR